MSMTSRKMSAALCAAVLLSGTAYAQQHDDDRFKPRVYGNLGLSSVQAPVTTMTRNVVIEPVSTTGATHVIHSSTPSGHYTSSDVEAEAQRIIAFQNAAPIVQPYSERQYEIELFEPVQTQASSAVTTYEGQSYATHTVTNAQSHIVTDGDTLYNVAKRYDTTVDALRSANGLTGNNIRIGQNITIPSTSRHILSSAPVYPQTYAAAPRSNVIRTVQPVPSRGVYAVLPKDTLYSISKRACVTVEGIQAQNNLGSSTDIAPGQRLNMPQGHCLN